MCFICHVFPRYITNFSFDYFFLLVGHVHCSFPSIYICRNLLKLSSNVGRRARIGQSCIDTTPSHTSSMRSSGTSSMTSLLIFFLFHFFYFLLHFLLLLTFHFIPPSPPPPPPPPPPDSPSQVRRAQRARSLSRVHKASFQGTVCHSHRTGVAPSSPFFPILTIFSWSDAQAGGEVHSGGHEVGGDQRQEELDDQHPEGSGGEAAGRRQ